MDRMKYISLEELQGLSNQALHERWDSGGFPFDIAKCGNCVTQHRHRPCACQEFQASAQSLSVTDMGLGLRENLEQIYALRLFYRSLYAAAPEPAGERQEVERLVEKEA